jgi:hypothetical protein
LAKLLRLFQDAFITFTKNTFMTLQEERQLLKKELDNIDDLQVIKAIKQILLYAKFNRQEEALKPFTKAEIVKRAKISEDDIQNKRTTNAKSLRKEIRNW